VISRAEATERILAIVRTALERTAEQMDSEEPHTCLLTDSLVGLSSTRLAEDADADRACVVVAASTPCRALGVGRAHGPG
jgi:hypothetical protein